MVEDQHALLVVLVVKFVLLRFCHGCRKVDVCTNCPLLALHAVGTQLLYWLRLYSPTILALKFVDSRYSIHYILMCCSHRHCGNSWVCKPLRCHLLCLATPLAGRLVSMIIETKSPCLPSRVHTKTSAQRLYCD